MTKRRILNPSRRVLAASRHPATIGGWLRPAPAALLLATALVLLAAGCGPERAPQRPGLAALQIEADFGDTKSGASPSSVHQVTAEAFELVGAGRVPVLRDSASYTLPSGQRHYRIELFVPPADLYRIRLIMNGTTGTPGNPSDDGLLYLGEGNVEGVRSGSSHPVVISMLVTVPIVLLETTEQGWRVSWSPLTGALSYFLRETLPPPHGVTETPTLRTDTLVAFPPTFKIEQKANVSFQVAARFPEGFTGAFSPKVTSAVSDPMSPGQIVDLRAGVVGADSLVLLWTATGDDGRVGRAARYDLRRSATAPILTEADFAAATPVAGLAPPRTAGAAERLVVRDLNPATTYHFAIKAIDDVPLASILSNPLSVTTLPLPPAAPGNLRVTKLSPTALLVRWDDHAVNEEGYEVVRRGPADPEFGPDTTLTGSFSGTVALHVTGLSPRTVYGYRVRAINAGGVSAWSDSAGARTGIPAPDFTSATAPAPDSVALAWAFRSVPSPADGFRLERRIGSAAFVEVAGPAPEDRAFGDGGLIPLTTYAYRLRAAEAGDLSDPSDTVEVTTPDLSPACRVDPTILAFGTVQVGSWADSVFTISNTGGGLLTGTIATTCPGFSVVAGGGELSLGAGDSRQVTVRFAPAGPGAARCTITPSDACGPIICSGTGEALSACAVDPAELDFGTVPLGSSADRSFTISNSGGGTLSGTVDVLCDAYAVVSGGGDFALGAGETQEVTIRFTPTSPGEVPCTVTPTGSCPPVACSGTGEALPLCSVNPTSLDFGTVPIGTFADTTVTITNIGGGTLSGSVVARCSNYAVIDGSGSFSLGAGQSRVVTIRFTPSVEPISGCTVSLGAAGCSSISCIGAGEAHPICELNPASLDFGVVPIGTFADRSFTITNTGGGKIAGMATVETACGDFTISSGGEAFSLSAGASISVTVRFTPHFAVLSSCPVTFGAGANDVCSDLPCTGTGLGPVCVVSPTTLDFGTLEAGERATRTFTVTNAGGGNLNGVVFRTCPNFVLDAGDGSYSLGPGASLTVTLAYAPSSPGSHVCRVETGCSDAVIGNGIATDPNDHWWPDFSGNAPNGMVNTLALHGTSLAVGGTFGVVGPSPTAYLAWWNGAAWTTTDNYTWNQVQVLQQWPGALGRGTLVAAGVASDYGGTTAAQFEDGSWQILGGSFEGGGVKVLGTWQDGLYLGGSFSPRLTSWDGSSWVDADQGISGPSVNDVESSSGRFYAASGLVLDSGATVGAIYRLIGSSWTVVASSLGGAPLSSVEKLADHGGTLYAIVSVGSSFSVVRLAGTTLVSVGEADNGAITDIASDGTRLYAVGTFAGLGGVAATRVAAWDGSAWHPLGSGIAGGQAFPKVVLPFDGSIYVGGDFTTAGGKDSPYIARWIP